MTSFIITGAIGSVIGATSLHQYAVLWLMAAFPFYSSIWEENITGFLYLPPINGVSEGAVVTSIALHTFGTFGVNFLNQSTVILGINLTYRNALIFGFAGTFGVVFTIIT